MDIIQKGKFDDIIFYVYNNLEEKKARSDLLPQTLQNDL